MNFWKWSGESRYPGALPSLLENFRSAVSPDPTDYPWVSEDGIGQITVPMDKGNAGSGEEKDSKCRQDPSGRPARVVKRWGGGSLHHPFRGHIEWKFISHFTKNNLANEVHYESQFKSERVYFTRKKG